MHFYYYIIVHDQRIPNYFSMYLLARNHLLKNTYRYYIFYFIKSVTKERKMSDIHFNQHYNLLVVMQFIYKCYS
jgi:hypothetical protein